MAHYDHKTLETKWQKRWEEQGIYRLDAGGGRPKYYCLEMFPYPSGRCHMGHVRNYSIGDVVARFKRMNGLERAPSHGLGRLRPAGGERGHQEQHPPRQVDLGEHRRHAPQLKRLGFCLRLGAGSRHLPPRLLQVDPVALPAVLQEGAGLQEDGAGQLVPCCQTVLANEQVVQGAC